MRHFIKMILPLFLMAVSTSCNKLPIEDLVKTYPNCVIEKYVNDVYIITFNEQVIARFFPLNKRIIIKEQIERNIILIRIGAKEKQTTHNEIIFDFLNSYTQ